VTRYRCRSRLRLTRLVTASFGALSDHPKPSKEGGPIGRCEGIRGLYQSFGLAAENETLWNAAQSALMSAALMIGHHFSISAF
jgi:hypothetical protein